VPRRRTDHAALREFAARRAHRQVPAERVASLDLSVTDAALAGGGRAADRRPQEVVHDPYR